MNSTNSEKSLKRGVIWTLFNRTSVLAMQFIAMIVLARFLSPSDFAVVGIALFFISISQTLFDSGMGGSLLRKKDIEDVDYSTLFIYNMGIGIIMYLLLLILAKPIASFYKQEELVSIFNVIGFSIVVSAFGKIQYIILLRELKFRQIATIAIISSSISLLIAILMAIKGYGVWALVIQNLINYSLTVLLQFLYNRYFPQLKFSMRSFKEQWDFGSYLFYSHILDTAYQNIFSLIFPKISSFNFSGLFTQAYKIQRLPLNVISSITQVGVFPVLAKIDNEKLFMETNKTFTRKTYLTSFTLLSAMCVFSEQAIVILLGSKWIEAAPILSLLSIGGIGVVVSMMVRNSLKSMGKTMIIFKIEILKSFIGIAMLIATFVFGSYYILVGIVIANFLSSFVSITYLSRVSKFTVKEQFKDFAISLLPVISSAIVSYMFICITFMDNVSTLLLGMFIFILCVFLFGNIFKNNDIKQIQYFLLLKLSKRF